VTGKEVSVHPVRPRSGDTRELAARLAPLEEISESSETRPSNTSQLVAQQDGAIVVGVEQPEVAQEVVETEDRNGALGLEPVVIVIVVLMLAFIVFITWQISQMPVQQVFK
jgi:hypothetical protein